MKDENRKQRIDDEKIKNFIFMNRSREYLIDSIIQDLLNLRRVKVWDNIVFDLYNNRLDKIKIKLELLYLHKYSHGKVKGLDGRIKGDEE